MYSTERTKKTQKITNELVNLLKTSLIPASRVNELREVLRIHEYRYYVLNEPLLADFEYDQLYKKKKKIERNFTKIMSSAK